MQKRAQPKNAAVRRLPPIRKHFVCQALDQCSATRRRDGVAVARGLNSAIEMSKNLNGD